MQSAESQKFLEDFAAKQAAVDMMKDPDGIRAASRLQAEAYKWGEKVLNATERLGVQKSNNTEKYCSDFAAKQAAVDMMKDPDGIRAAARLQQEAAKWCRRVLSAEERLGVKLPKR